jgi:hypothetical protein
MNELNAMVEFPERTLNNVKLKAAPRRWDLFRMELDDEEGGFLAGEVFEVEWTPNISVDLIVRVRPKGA